MALLLLPFCTYATAQIEDAQEWESIYNELYDIDEVENEDAEHVYDVLSDIAADKINLNDATRDDIEQLVFLTPQQVEDLCEYIDRYAPLRSINELRMIASIDIERQQLLRHFVYVGEAASEKSEVASAKDLFDDGRNELIATGRIPLYERAGDKEGYLGPKYKHWVRYTFTGKHLKAGFIGAQDAGEPFFTHGNDWGYDHYSFYVVAKDIGRFKTIAVGRYRVKFGMGLVINNDFSFGKTASLYTTNSNNAIRGHSSRSDYNYLQGAAATFTIAKGLDVSAFVSYRKIDATESGDTAITTILKTGYHRTETEMSHKNNTSQFVVGGNVRYTTGGLHIGATGLFSSLDKTLSPNTSQLYRLYYPAGKTFANYSVDYGYTSHYVTAEGETAMDKDGAAATINRLILKATSNLSFTLLQRFYSYRYSALFAKCFSDGGRMQNESGLYAGATWTASSGTTVMAYVDYARYAWLRYQVSDRSHSWDYYLAVTHRRGALTLYGRYRIRLRRCDNDSDTGLMAKNEQRGRVSATLDYGTWRAAIQGDYSAATVSHSHGYMLSCSGGYKQRAFAVDVGAAYFHTDDYNSRVYLYERSTLYSLSNNVFYGRGMRLYVKARVDIVRNVDFIAKVGGTKYFDRDVISSSYQQIDGSSMTDIDLQIRWRF